MFEQNDTLLTDLYFFNVKLFLNWNKQILTNKQYKVNLTLC